MNTPRPYQVDGISIMKDRNLLLGDDCGLGKTLQAVEAARHLSGPKLVICPKVIKEQWVEEITIQLSPSSIQEVVVLGVAGRPPPGFNWADLNPPASTPPPNVWVITHYETLLRIGQVIAAIPWVLIIADECHRIKNRKAKQSLWLKQVKGRHPDRGGCRKLGLSATPMERRPSELWSQLNWLYPKKFTSYWRFRSWYDDEDYPYPGADFKSYLGPKNQEKMAEEIDGSILIRDKEEVAPDLPPKIVQRIPLEMASAQKKIYDRIATSKDIEVLVGEFRDEKVMVIPNTLAHMIRLQQVSTDPRLLDFQVKSSKIEWLKDWLDDNPTTTTLIFTKFRQTAIQIAGQLGAVLLVGGTPNPITHISKFLTGQNRLMVGTIDAMREGLNLQIADTAIFLDQHWSSTKMKQAVDRIHRINITNTKHIIHLYHKGTVDELILKALDKKWSDKELVERFLRKENM